MLLTQNPYAGPTEDPDPFFVNRGYIFVSVTVRGTLDSEAPGGGPLVNDMFSPREAQDGVELVNWAAHQLNGSNGVVGLTGCSQLGDNQLFTAAAVGPHSPVKAILPACAGKYLRRGLLLGRHSGSHYRTVRRAVAAHRRDPASVGERAFTLALEQEILAGGPRAYDNLYWQQRTTTPALAAQIVRNGIPALLWTGWNAPDSIGSLEMYAAFQNTWLGKSAYAPMGAHQPTTGRYQIVVGPWGHGQGLDESIELEWYDTWLKGEHTDMTDTRTPMHLYQNGSGWVNASTDPVAPSYTPYYLNGGGALVVASHPLPTDRPAADDASKRGVPDRPFEVAALERQPAAPSQQLPAGCPERYHSHQQRPDRAPRLELEPTWRAY